MTAKQSNGVQAPDGSLYITLTDGGGNLVDVGGAGNGTVTSVSVATANGVSAVTANPTTTPAMTFTLGAITPSTVNGVNLTTSYTGTIDTSSLVGKTITVTKGIITGFA
jgi:hypothetical protein